MANIVIDEIVTAAFLDYVGIDDPGTASVRVEWGTWDEGRVVYADSCGTWDPIYFLVIAYPDGRRVVSFAPVN